MSRFGYNIYYMKKLLAFDLDDTLAVTKSPIDDRMADVLAQILDHFDVCIISGGKYELFQNQVIDRLKIDDAKLARLHLMPTCGTRYYRWDIPSQEWKLQYAEDLTEDEVGRTRTALESAARQLGYWPENPAGEVIENRDSQVTYSGLGQLATPEAKYAWDPDRKKRLAIREIAAKEVPDLEIRVAGTTSIDVTRKGIDKAYGMQKLMDAAGLEMSDILFFGDMLGEGGNDYPVRAMGIDSLEVEGWEDTVGKLQAILHVL